MTATAELQSAVRQRVASHIAPQAFARLSTLLDVSEPRRRTGQLHRSKQLRSRLTPSGFEITVAYTAPQAAFTNTGTRPHRIVARRKGALAFVSGGRRVVVKSVNHPGNRGTHWFDRATRNWPGILHDVTS